MDVAAECEARDDAENYIWTSKQAFPRHWQQVISADMVMTLAWSVTSVESPTIF
jgi:hypothetical protein